LIRQWPRRGVQDHESEAVDVPEEFSSVERLGVKIVRRFLISNLDVDFAFNFGDSGFDLLVPDSITTLCKV